MLYASFWKPHESESEAHLSIADLVCATSQQHFRGQETELRGTQINRAAFKVMGDRKTTF